MQTMRSSTMLRSQSIAALQQVDVYKSTNENGDFRTDALEDCYGGYLRNINDIVIVPLSYFDFA